MTVSTSTAPWSTVAALPDYLLLAQTRQLARHEQALQILVLDHLREIEARRLHLTRGYGSLFDYVVRELDYTAAAASRRIKAMRLCSDTNGARELLQRGKLNVSNAAQLQNLFERSDRRHGRAPGSHGSGGGPGGQPRDAGAPAAPMHGGGSAPEAGLAPGAGPAAGAGPVLDAAARERLVQQAAGKSTREVQQMLAEVDPELARPSDRMRALGGGRWELKASVGAECRHGLEQLLMLLSHRDPHLTLGGLVERLVRDGLDRYDPARPPRPRRTGGRRTGGRGSVSSEGSAGKLARAAEAAQPTVASATGPDAEAGQRSMAGAKGNGEWDDVSPAAARDGAARPSAPKWNAAPEDGGANSSAGRDVVRRPGLVPKCASKAERGSATLLAVPGSSGYTASLAKCKSDIEFGRRSRAAARDSGKRSVTAANPDRETEHGSASPVTTPNSGGQATSAAKWPAYVSGHGATGPAERSPALARHLAALSSFGTMPGSRSRYIPAAVRREVWRRDRGCCSYVDRHSGRRCGSRYRLEIDHVVPFALGGATELSNVRLRCRAHHRLRHAQRHAHAANWPAGAKRPAVSAAEPVQREQTVESHEASLQAGAAGA